MTLALGWIPYWNLLPLKHELERTAGAEIEFVKGLPSQVNKWLVEGKIVAAPCSSVCLLKSSKNEIALPLGIASSGPVTSVYIGVQTEHAPLLEVIKARKAIVKDLFRQATLKLAGDARKQASFVWRATREGISAKEAPPLAITPASASSAHLGRILYRLWFGEEAYEMRAAPNAPAANSVHLGDQRPMELLIGDEALIKRSNYRAIIDLGEVWKEQTELPFVFAIWQTHGRSLSAYWRQALLEAAEFAQARMRVEPSYYLDSATASDDKGRPIDIGAYWKQIQYRLGPSHFKGLTLFLALARHLYGEEGVTEGAVANLMRWEHFPQSDRV